MKEEPKQLTSEVYEILQGIVDFPTIVHQPVVEKKVADPSLLVRELAEKLSACFLRNEGRFYHIDAPNVPLARRDMEQSFLNIIAPLYPKEQITNDVLRRVFDVAIERKHSDRTRCLIPRFDGAILSQEWKEVLWDKFVTGAPRPRTPSEQQYSDRKLRSRS